MLWKVAFYLFDIKATHREYLQRGSKITATQLLMWAKLRHFEFLIYRKELRNENSHIYRGADKSLARPERKQATATKL